MYKLVFLLVLATNIIQAQTTKSIIGKWAFKDIYEKEKLDKESVGALTLMLGDMVYFFHENKKYYTTTVTKEDGDWTFDESTKQIKMITTKGKFETFSVLAFTDSTLSVEFSKGKGIVFKRVNLTAADLAIQVSPTISYVSATPQAVCKKWYLQRRERPGLTEEMIQMFAKAEKGIYYEFRSDFTFTFKGIGEPEMGSWAFGSDNKTITVTSEFTKKLWSIKSVSDTELVLVQGTEDTVWTFSIKE